MLPATRALSFIVPFLVVAFVVLAVARNARRKK